MKSVFLICEETSSYEYSSSVTLMVLDNKQDAELMCIYLREYRDHCIKFNNDLYDYINDKWKKLNYEDLPSYSSVRSTKHIKLRSLFKRKALNKDEIEEYNTLETEYLHGKKYANAIALERSEVSRKYQDLQELAKKKYFENNFNLPENLKQLHEILLDNNIDLITYPNTDADYFVLEKKLISL